MNRTFSHLCDHLAFRSLESKPPIHLWTPSVSRTIDILIKGDGSWWHEGRKIHRKKLIKLFASILRKESNGEYHLVTPQEKWRIKVELLPLVIIAIEKTTSAIGPKLDVMLNTEEVVPINNLHKIELEERAGHIASVTLWNGLSALFNRASWYDLINLCDEDLFVESRGEKFSLLA